MAGTAAIPMKGIQIQKALVTRIALFLKILNRKNYRGLLSAGSRRRLSSEKELLRFMVAENYIDPGHVERLKVTCRNFAGTQDDIRFGALAVAFDFVSRLGLGQVLNEQKRLEQSGDKRFIGDLLVTRGLLSDQQKKLILHKQKMEQELKRTVAGLGPDVSIYRENEVTIYITGDELGAYAVKTRRFNERFGTADLKRILMGIGVIFGVVPDEKLTCFLREGPVQGAPFEVARGRKSVPARDARIKYMFSRDYLSAGFLGEDGTMDFKNRGEIPLVKKDEVVAAKVPPRQGRDGINVFGNTLAAAPPKDITVRCGKGVRLSEDRRTALAARDGFPELTRDGILTVSDVHVIRGDVDYTTGHIRFEKDVYVTGRIRAGFKVEAHNVTAGAVDGGAITALGNIVVTNGVIDATIKVEGNFNAGFVHRSTIFCMGQASIEKEIVESTLFSEGRLNMHRGTMLASSVSARGGARIKHVGSEKTKPSTIVVGVSPHMPGILKIFDNRIKAQQSLWHETILECRQLETRLRKSGDADHTLAGELKALRKKADKLAGVVKYLGDERSEVVRRLESSVSKSELEVAGNILSGTRINGVHALTVLRRDLAKVKISELLRPVSNTTGKNGWEIVTEPL